MNVEQVLAEVAHLGGGCGAAIDPGAALALRIDRAAQQQGVREVEARVVQPVVQAGRIVELGAHVGAAGAFAHHAGIGTRAQRQLQRTDQNGLAGSGLSREDRETVGQIELELMHDDEVAQGQAFECHFQEPPSFQ